MSLARYRVAPFFVVLAPAFCLARVAPAQDMPIVRTGNTEMGGFVGASFGIDKARVMGGGNIAYAATRVVMPSVELSTSVCEIAGKGAMYIETR